MAGSYFGFRLGFGFQVDIRFRFRFLFQVRFRSGFGFRFRFGFGFVILDDGHSLYVPFVPALLDQEGFFDLSLNAGWFFAYYFPTKFWGEGIFLWVGSELVSQHKQRTASVFH